MLSLLCDYPGLAPPPTVVSTSFCDSCCVTCVYTTIFSTRFSSGEVSRELTCNVAMPVGEGELPAFRVLTLSLS